MQKHPFPAVTRTLVLCALLAVVLCLNGMATPAHADTFDVPQLFVHDNVEGMALQGTTLFWETNCGGECSPARSRLRSTNSRGTGGIGSTLYYPAACHADRVASGNVAVDNTNVFWLTGDGRLVRL